MLNVAYQKFSAICSTCFHLHVPAHFSVSRMDFWVQGILTISSESGQDKSSNQQVINLIFMSGVFQLQGYFMELYLAICQGFWVIFSPNRVLYAL